MMGGPKKILFEEIESDCTIDSAGESDGMSV
jgi:hypothetical protein